jgi:hypothetical protein
MLFARSESVKHFGAMPFATCCGVPSTKTMTAIRRTGVRQKRRALVELGRPLGIFRLPSARDYTWVKLSASELNGSLGEAISI